MSELGQTQAQNLVVMMQKFVENGYEVSYKNGEIYAIRRGKMLKESDENKALKNQYAKALEKIKELESENSYLFEALKRNLQSLKNLTNFAASQITKHEMRGTMPF